MANTSVHLPDDLLQRLDAAAARMGVSRNRLVVESCQRFLDAEREWPAGFFAADRLGADDLALLRDGAEDWESSLVVQRRSGERAPW